MSAAEKHFKLCILITDAENGITDKSTARSKAKTMKADGTRIMEISVGVATTTTTTNLEEVSSCDGVTSGCDYFSSETDFTKLQANAASIANTTIALVNVTTTVNVTQEVTSREEVQSVENVTVTEQEKTNTETLCTTDEAYFTFLLLAVPLLVYLFYKPLEYCVVAFYNRHIRGTARDSKFFKYLFEGSPRAGPPPVPSKPAPAAVPDAQEPPAAAAAAAAPPGQARFKWKVKETAFIRNSGKLTVDWGDKFGLPPSISEAETKRCAKRLPPALPARPWAAEAEDISERPAVRALASVYSGGEWQDRVSRWACAGCWARVDAARARRAQEAEVEGQKDGASSTTGPAQQTMTSAALTAGGGGAGGDAGVQIELAEMMDRRRSRAAGELTQI